jgi:hypothetical protein
MKRYRPKWMDILVCPKGHQGIYLNGKPFCLECKCPIEASAKAAAAPQEEQEEREEAEGEQQDTA